MVPNYWYHKPQHQSKSSFVVLKIVVKFQRFLDDNDDNADNADDDDNDDDDHNVDEIITFIECKFFKL